MKIHVILALLSSGFLSIGAMSSGLILSKEVVPAMTARRRHDQIQIRILEVSQQCETDTMALYNNPELATAFAAWETDVAQIEDDVCSTNVDTATVSCTLDSTTLSTHDSLVDACELVGGTTYLYSDSVTCRIEDNGVGVWFNVRFVDAPECIAASCDLENVEEELANLADELAQFYEDELSYQFDNAQCSSAEGLLDTTPLLGIVSVMSALVLLMV